MKLEMVTKMMPIPWCLESFSLFFIHLVWINSSLVVFIVHVRYLHLFSQEMYLCMFELSDSSAFRQSRDEAPTWMDDPDFLPTLYCRKHLSRAPAEADCGLRRTIFRISI
jgi:hypothetical protein